jgi:hypothetical protein
VGSLCHGFSLPWVIFFVGFRCRVCLGDQHSPHYCLVTSPDLI